MPFTPRTPGESPYELQAAYEAASRLRGILARPPYENAEELERARSEALSLVDSITNHIGGLLR